MADNRFAAAVAEARRAPLRLATLTFFVILGVHALFDGIGIGSSAGFLHRVIVSAASAALFVAVLRSRSR